MKRRLWSIIILVLFGNLILGCSQTTTVFQGQFVQQDAPGAKMRIQGDQVLMTEGEGIKQYVSKITGKIYFVSNQKGREEFKVKWKVTDPNAIKKSRFLAEYDKSKFIGLRELVEGGVGENMMNVLYLPDSSQSFK